ncbi:MAG: arsenate reductase (glutaredoxin) [Woeseiaceae bacterium]
MTITIYHNPRCSKSRQTLALIEEAGVTPHVVEYLKDTPSAATIAGLAASLGVAVVELVRSAESDYREATDRPDLKNNDALAAWIAAHPKVLQRPIVVNEDTRKAVIGRPPENVLGIIG